MTAIEQREDGLSKDGLTLTITPLPRRKFLVGCSSIPLAVYASPLRRFANLLLRFGELGTPEYEEIAGIRVYGHKAPITDRLTVQTIVEQEEEEAIPGITSYINSRDSSYANEFRETMLYPNVRYVEAIVSKSLYDKIPQEDGVENFPQWFKNHADGLTEILGRDVPDMNLTIKAKRIIVVDDSLIPEPDRSIQQTEYFGWTIYQGDRYYPWDNLGRVPLDVDGRIRFERDYLAKRPHKTQLQLTNGKEIPFDSSFIHHYFLHPLFNLYDLYWHEGSILGQPEYLQGIIAYHNDMMGPNPSSNQISPATALRIKRLVVDAGYRGALIDGFPASLQRLLPDQASFSFVLPDGTAPQKIGNVQYTSVDRATDLSKFYHAKSNRQYIALPLSGEVTKTSERLTFSRDQLRVLRKDTFENITHPYFIVDVSFLSNSSEILHFPIPSQLLYMAHDAGVDSPNFQVNFTDKVYSLGKKLSLSAIWKNDFQQKMEGRNDVFAYCDVPGSDAVHIWEWQPEVGGGVSPVCALAAGAVVAASVRLSQSRLQKPQSS